MVREIVARVAANDGEIWLGLRVGLDRDRVLLADQPARSEREPEGVGHERDGRRVRSVLRLGDDQLAADQLDGLVLPDDSEISEASVLLPRPWSESRRIRPHHAHATRDPTTPSTSTLVDARSRWPTRGRPPDSRRRRRACGR